MPCSSSPNTYFLRFDGIVPSPPPGPPPFSPGILLNNSAILSFSFCASS